MSRLLPFLILLILSACQAPTPLPATATRAQPTSSAPPSSTPPVSYTATVSASPSPMPIPDPHAIAAAVLSELSIQTTSSLSPDGLCTWQRLTASALNETALRKYDTGFFTRVTVTCRNDEPHVLVSDWLAQEIGYPLPEPLGWSPDGDTLYFYDSLIADGCPALGGFGANLRRVNLSSGAIDSIPYTWTGGLVLSPAATQVVSYDQRTQSVSLFNLLTREEQRYRFALPAGLEYWYAGGFTWAPDGRAVLFIVRYGDPCFPTGSSLRRLDLSTGQFTTLLENDDPALTILEWGDPARARLFSQGQELLLDPYTGRPQLP